MLYSALPTLLWPFSSLHRTNIAVNAPDELPLQAPTSSFSLACPPSSSSSFGQSHVFVFITDEAASTDVLQGLRDDEVLVCAGNEKQFFGAFLARSKLYHDQEENLSRVATTLVTADDAAAAATLKRRRIDPPSHAHQQSGSSKAEKVMNDDNSSGDMES